MRASKFNVLRRCIIRKTNEQDLQLNLLKLKIANTVFPVEFQQNSKVNEQIISIV